MFTFLRRARRNLLDKSKLGKYLAYAFGEIILVVFGILLALQINNWNQDRKEASKERSILRRLQADLAADTASIAWMVNFQKGMVEDYYNALDILSEKKSGSKDELLSDLSTILQVGGVTLNATTFNNLRSAGEIRLIRDRNLAEKIVNYYNTDYLAWQSALREYTRNITAPFFMSFDYLAKNKIKLDLEGMQVDFPGSPDDYVKEAKSLEDYKNSYFVINTLRQKIWNLNALIVRYQELYEKAKSLDVEIQAYIKS